MTRTVAVFLFAAALAAAADQPTTVGQFEGQTDIAASVRPGAAEFDSATGAYTITGGGLNMWANTDAFHYVWKKIEGDFAIIAQVRITTGGEGSNEHRKAGLVVRQSLDPDSPYIDVILHGSGLTAMQFRTAPAGPTEQVETTVTAPAVLQLVRHGDVFEMWLAQTPNVAPRKVGSRTLALKDPVYVGLAVCAHDAGRMETAEFSNVKIGRVFTPAEPK
jgi:hypothetical protein